MLDVLHQNTALSHDVLLLEEKRQLYYHTGIRFDTPL